ncbi:helix-turn-helix domain-containing protein [Kitasatospora sp. NPDC005856]|uniref:helix-turn-helix domain-containing protein n=1 Tax=Kitasatospora sp. NPDC005856 TaxID=3154566 RepID=UPI0033FDA35B
MTAERRAFREQVRLEAGARFEAGEKTAGIARDLRVSERSVERWRPSRPETGAGTTHPLRAGACHGPGTRRGAPRRVREAMSFGAVAAHRSGVAAALGFAHPRSCAFVLPTWPPVIALAAA